MFTNFPGNNTDKAMRRNWECKLCMLLQQRKQNFFRNPRSDQVIISDSTKPRLQTEKPGDFGQIDLWGPHPAGRQGISYVFSMTDVFGLFQVRFKAKNDSGGSLRIVKKALE